MLNRSYFSYMGLQKFNKSTSSVCTTGLINTIIALQNCWLCYELPKELNLDKENDRKNSTKMTKSHSCDLDCRYLAVANMIA